MEETNLGQSAILTLETSASQCSVALRLPSGERLQEIKQGSNVHSQVVLPMVKQVLDQAGLSLTDLAAIGVCRGPGSFTGLRIGIGVAQGLAYGASLPMFGFSSLDVLLHQQSDLSEWQSEDRFVVSALDARMQEVYWAAYDLAPDLVPAGAVQVNKPAAALQAQMLQIREAIDHNRLTVLGNAWLEYPELATELGIPDELLPAESQSEHLLPTAMGLIALFERAENEGEVNSVLEPAADFAPLYVRDNVAAKPKPSIQTGAAVIK